MTAAALCAAGPASAAIIQISAAGLVEQCPCNTTNGAEESRGVLAPQGPGRFFAAVPNMPNGLQVCGFSLIYQDVNAAEQMTSYLIKRTFAVGGNPLSPPIVMATAKTAGGAVATTRIATTTAIASPAINTTNGFYYVRVDATNLNQNVIGLQIDVRSTCP